MHWLKSLPLSLAVLLLHAHLSFSEPIKPPIGPRGKTSAKFNKKAPSQHLRTRFNRNAGKQSNRYQFNRRASQKSLRSRFNKNSQNHTLKQNFNRQAQKLKDRFNRKAVGVKKGTRKERLSNHFKQSLNKKRLSHHFKKISMRGYYHLNPKWKKNWNKYMRDRNWNHRDIRQTLQFGKSRPHVNNRNNLNRGNKMRLITHPFTGRSLIIDTKSGEIIQLSGDGFKH